MHAGVKTLVRDLNQLYRSNAALHELDCHPDGFEWLGADDAENSVYSFVRRGRDGAPVVVIGNMTPIPRPSYRVGAPVSGTWEVRLNSDAEEYGGSGAGAKEPVTADAVSWHGRPQSLELDLPPLAVVILAPRP
jgi:1,4-alpha-glucan branching enzyme